MIKFLVLLIIKWASYLLLSIVLHFYQFLQVVPLCLELSQAFQSEITSWGKFNHVVLTGEPCIMQSSSYNGPS